MLRGGRRRSFWLIRAASSLSSSLTASSSSAWSPFAPMLCIFRSLSLSTFKARTGHSNAWNSRPKSYGPGSRTCHVCGNSHGLIRKYCLMCCRQCFCSNAKEISFIKYR